MDNRKQEMSKKGMTWTDKQREIVDLLQQGKTFTEIVDMGYVKSTVHKVKKALEDGQVPEVKEETGGNGKQGGKDGGPHDLLAIKTPSPAPIVYTLDRKDIHLDPLELNRQYGYYEDLSKNDGLNYSFSQILTMGIQLVWLLKQEIPLTENLLRAVLCGYR